MLDKFQSLRKYVFGCNAELIRFRQLVVNVVLATDIFDKQLNDNRKVRWQQAFNERGPDLSLRATIVIEHMIQVSTEWQRITTTTSY